MSNSRRSFIKTSIAGMAELSLLSLSEQAAKAASSGERPNILWLLPHDLSPDIQCYGQSLVRTPNLDRLAAEGARFTHTFTTSPVCSPARSAAITGMYPTTIGAHNHHSHRGDGYMLPAGVEPVTEYFRRAGYLTALMGTQFLDYNFDLSRPAFDASDWKERKPDQPFFAYYTFNETHREMGGTPLFDGWTDVRSVNHFVDPGKVKLSPVYPDHPVPRQAMAYYMDAIEVLDTKVGAILKRLVDEGLDQNTVVFFFSDHGRPMVWGKQWLYDEGLHIPLIIRWPRRIAPGTVREDLVSSIDISATALAAAGIQLPSGMQGQDLLAKGSERRRYVVGARDRCDETVERLRCVRTAQYKYIRNFTCDRPYTQPNIYKESCYPTLSLLWKLKHEAKLTPPQERFLKPTKPEEELYDLERDPNEIENLAGNPSHRRVLAEMRAILENWVIETRDKGGIFENPSVYENVRGEGTAFFMTKSLPFASRMKDEFQLWGWEQGKAPES